MNKQEIILCLSAYGIMNFTINDDLTVDVHQNVYLDRKGLTKLPFQFGTINGYFSCDGNNLTSLKNCPKIIHRSFWCQSNRLTSLEHFPKAIHGEFFCDDYLKKDPRYLRWLLAHKLSEL